MRAVQPDRTATGGRSAQAVALVVMTTVLLAPAASANCGINKFFRSAGSDSTENVRISPGYSGQAPGNEIGRWWDSNNAALSSNFGSNAGTCPSSGWWRALGNGNMQIDGILDGTGCVGYTGCPGLEMTIVVEDFGPLGPPGVGDSAYYLGFRVDDTPAELRRYDYGRTDNGTVGNTVYPFLEFPTVWPTGQVRLGSTVTVSFDLQDQDDHVHTAFGPSDAALPTTSVLAEWQILMFTGTQDPGRLRSAWTPLGSFPYVPGGLSGLMLDVPCADTVRDVFLAVGMGFNGGSGGTIDSELVGAAFIIECDPNLADPDSSLNRRFDRPDDRTQRPQRTPRSSGGRR